MPCCSSFFSSTARVPSTLHRLATSLSHIQQVSSNIHSSSLIPNKRKRHKNIKVINTTASPSLLFVVFVVVMHKYPKSKTRENVFLWNLKTYSCSHPNPKVKNLLQKVQFPILAKAIIPPKFIMNTLKIIISCFKHISGVDKIVGRENNC